MAESTHLKIKRQIRSVSSLIVTHGDATTREGHAARAAPVKDKCEARDARRPEKTRETLRDAGDARRRDIDATRRERRKETKKRERREETREMREM